MKIKDTLIVLFIVGAMSLVANAIGTKYSIVEAIPGLLFLIFLAIAGVILAKYLPGRIPAVAYIVTLGCLLPYPAMPGSDVINEAVKKVGFLQLCTPILAYAGITKDQLPPVVSTTYSQGLCEGAAKALRLPVGLPVVIGATDGVLVNVGIGAVEPGQLSGTIGTSGALRMLTRQPKTDPQMRTWCYNLTDDMWVAGGAINNGGMILRWVRDKICHYGGSALETLDIDPYDLMTMKAEHVDAGADGLIIEVHNDPAHAKCDGQQSLTPQNFDALMHKVSAMVDLMGKTLVK